MDWQFISEIAIGVALGGILFLWLMGFWEKRPP